MKVKTCPTCGQTGPWNLFCGEFHDLDGVAEVEVSEAPEQGCSGPTGPPPEEANLRPVAEVVADAADPATEANQGMGTRRLGVATLVPAETPGVSFTLRSGDVLGRFPRAQIDLGSLPRGDAISREHARVSSLGGRWFIEACSTTNPTLVRGVRLAAGQKAEISTGDGIVLGDTPFLFTA